MDMTQAMNARREFNDFSKAMAQFYMTVTSGATVYDRAKEAGHSDRTAGMITLGTLVGLNRLMSTEYGQYALRGIGLDDVSLNVGQVINREAREIASAYTANILNGAAAQPSTKWKAIKEISDVIFAGFKKAVDNPRTLLNSSLNEMVEEVTEELTEDVMMSLGAAATAIGITDSKISYNVDLSEIAARYGMAAAGGFLGGGLNHLNTSWNRMHGSLERSRANDRLVDALVEYGYDECVNYVNNAYESGKLPGSKDMSTRFHRDSDGEAKFYDSRNEEDS
jgi:hypothetical protein